MIFSPPTRPRGTRTRSRHACLPVGREHTERNVLMENREVPILQNLSRPSAEKEALIFSLQSIIPCGVHFFSSRYLPTRETTICPL